MLRCAVNQGCMSLSTYYLKYGRHLAQLHRRRLRSRRRAYAPMSNTGSHDNHEKITIWVSFNSLYGYEAPLGRPSGCRSSAITKKKWFTALHLCKFALITHHATKSVNQSIALPS